MKMFDGKDNDDYLWVLEGLLNTIHSSYYQAYDKFKNSENFKVPKLPGQATTTQIKPKRPTPPTTYDAMHLMKSYVLKDCVIAFENHLLPENAKENKRRRLYGPVQEN